MHSASVYFCSGMQKSYPAHMRDGHNHRSGQIPELQ